MFKKKEIIIPESKIKTRIKELFRKSKKIYSYIREWDKKFHGIIQLTMDGEPFAYVVILNTIYGRRSLIIEKDSLKYVEYNFMDILKKQNKFILDNSILEDAEYLFYIKTNKGVDFYPKYSKLKYEDIDLAILEFEEIINKMFLAAIKQEEYIKQIESKLVG